MQIAIDQRTLASLLQRWEVGQRNIFLLKETE